MTLTKLPLSKWWVETDENGEIIATYNKAAITADIRSIKNTLGTKTLKAEEERMVLLLQNNVEDSELISKMAEAYRTSMETAERAALETKLQNLIDLRKLLI